ncbi:MAG: hypothetical protein JO107_17165 [Hyphomicrobiales bacterium]|nr:hypothetical protein [Hyphomicrobiales bacterium]
MASDLSPAALPFLDGLAHSARLTDRLLWLRVATDYFLANPLHGRRAEFAAALSESLRNVDEATRYAVARKLAPCAEAGEVLTTLVSLGGEAALYALRHAVGLPRPILVEAAEGDAARARSVARRGDLDAEIVAALSEHSEIEVLLALARNRRAPFNSRLFAKLARRAGQNVETAGDRRLAQALMERGAGLEPAALFLEADSGQRAAMMTAAQRAALGGWRAPASLRGSPEAIERLERFALDAEPERFAAALAEALECPAGLAERIASDPSGEPLAVALAALGAPADVTVRILTSRDLQDGADYRRIGALARFKDALNPAAAELLVAAMIGEAARSHPRRQSTVLDPHAAAAPSRPQSFGSTAAPKNWLKETDLTPAALRRRRAFALGPGRREG